MLESRVEFFRTNGAECCTAAETVKYRAIKQAYLELAQGWRVLADMSERFGWQAEAAKPYRIRALPHRALDEFYDLSADRDGRPRRRA
jgi:hypothetical protein